MTIINEDNKRSKLISVKNVGLYYTRRKYIYKKFQYWAIRDVSFDLYTGETLGIIGRNGVGKSTILRVLAGIVSPNTGTVQVYNPELRISLISLQAGFMPFLSGRENAILNGLLLGATKKEILSHIDDIAAFSELNGFFDQPVETYSTGMKARLGFSVAYYVDPDVILLDEVLGVGDAAFQQKSAEAMKQRIRSDKTVVLVSHNVHLIKELCDRLVWIENGITRAQGNVSDVLDAYLQSIQENTPSI